MENVENSVRVLGGDMVNIINPVDWAVGFYERLGYTRDDSDRRNRMSKIICRK